jgi:hypothetical protein
LDPQANTERSDTDPSLVQRVESNARLMEQLLDQFNDLREQLVPPQDTAPNTNDVSDTVSAEVVDDLQRQIGEFQDRIAELEQQNHDLASQVANSSVQQTVACADSGSGDALSWEDRKKLILQQMEADSFDAESFHNELQSDSAEKPLDPITYVEELHSELARKNDDVQRRDEEIGELRCLLEQQSGTRSGGLAVGAAAIAEMVDADELVQQERERLQQLQEQWKEKFRQGEIEASLERAKLSRERQELAQKHSELEERLEHLSRESRHAEESGTTSRRWLAKLGLAES